MKYIYIYIKKIIIKDFGNSVEIAKFAKLQVPLKYYFRNIKYFGLNENCFIGHLVV